MRETVHLEWAAWGWISPIAGQQHFSRQTHTELLFLQSRPFYKGGFFTEKDPQGNTSAPAQLQRVQTQTGIINTIYRKDNKID